MSQINGNTQSNSHTRGVLRLKKKIIRAVFVTKAVLALLAAILILFLPWEHGYGYNFLMSSNILHQVYVNGSAVGGLSPNSAAAVIQKGLKNRPGVIFLQSGTKYFEISEEDIALQYDLNATLERALAVGRDKDILSNITTHIQLTTSPKRIGININYDNLRLDTAVASISAELVTPEIPARIELVGEGKNMTASVSAGVSGRNLDEQGTKELILEAFSTQNYGNLELPIEVTYSPVSREQIVRVEELAQNLIGKELILNFEGERWILTDTELINFLSVYEEFDKEKIESWVVQLEETVNRQPVNALFEFDGIKVNEFKAANAGVDLDEEATSQEIVKAVKRLSGNGEEEYSMDLVANYTQPDITTENVNDLGIKEVIGKGESWFSHSIPSRVHNVSLSAANIHGTLVAPGEIFSFVDAVGEIDAAHGFQSAYVIQSGKTILGDGGGVCQVSTTLFRAVLDAGLEIVERRPHSYRVGYYEENYDVGIDATIYSPSVDLKFRNDTDNYILIQTYVDPVNTYMNFEIYGSEDGREVALSKPKIWNQIPPPPDRYQDDPTLPPGVVKQIDWKAWGASVSFDWVVTKGGEVLHEETFYSNYQPWQAVYLRGI
jgi:vancomycin resistance protein YoaR